MEKRRSGAQDVAKGLMIIGVIFFHSLILTYENKSEPLSVFNILVAMFPFLLSSFFFYSGYNYKPNKRTFLQNVGRRAKQLLLPFVIAFITSTVILGSMELAFDHANTLATLQRIGDTVLFSIQPLLLLHPFPSDGSLVFGIYLALGLLWFLYALFICSVFFFLLVKLTNKKLWALALVVLGLLTLSFCLGQFVGIYLPYACHAYPVILALMLTGAYLKQHSFLEREVKSKKDVLIYGLFALLAEGVVVGISLFCHFQFGSTTVGALPGGLFDAKIKGFDAFATFVMGVAGVYFLHTVCRVIVRLPVLGKCLQWFGSHSAIFYLFHPIFLELASLVIFQRKIVWGHAQAFFFVAVVVALLSLTCFLLDHFFLKKNNNAETPTLTNSKYEKTEVGDYLFEDAYKVSEEDKATTAIWFEDRKYSYGELEKSVDHYARFLADSGVKVGDHVALLGVNSYNWLVAFYAIIRVGAVAVLFNYLARHETLVGLIKDTDCTFLCYGKYTAMIKKEGEFAALLEETNIPAEHAFSIMEDDLDFKAILAKEAVKPFTSPLSRAEDSKRTSYIIFTTGTTAKPKPAMLSQYSVMNILYLNFGRLDSYMPQKFMCLLPMFHCFGLLVTNACLTYGKTVYLNTMFDKVKIYKEFLKNKCGGYASVSIIFDRLAHGPFWWLHRANFVKCCIVGGGFTSAHEFKFLEKKYGKGKFLNGYGQTECSPMISLVYPDTPRIKQTTTVGSPMKGIELAFMDVATKKLLPPGKPGEILVKGYNVFNGYYKMDKENQPFDEDGYLHTGDLGYIDEDGYLVLSGRIKDIIIRKGENISPKEIEDALRKYPEFGNVRALGFPSIDEGEYIIGCVELKKKPPHFVEEKYLNDMAKTLPSIKIPSHIVYMKQFPLTANGKLDEAKLREICILKIAKFLNEEVLAKRTRKLMAESHSNRH